MTTYYINTASTGSGDGTTTATAGANAAWKDISEITGLSAGDTINFNKGDEWRETLTVPSSGSDGSLITFDAYGSGDAPIIKGSDLVATWADQGSNVWRASLATTPSQVLFDGTVGDKKTVLGNLADQYDWYYDGSTYLYTYAASDPDALYTSPGVEASIRNYCISSDTKDYIITQNLLIQHAKHSGINSLAGDYWTIQNNECSYNYRNGIRLNTNCNNNTISTNTCHHQTNNEGILLEGDTTNDPLGADNTISTNTCYDNNDGIQLIGDESYFGGLSEAGNIIEHNTCYNHPVKHGITSEQTRNLVVRYNTVYDNATGIAIYTEKAPQVYYNLAYSNVGTGIFISKQAGASGGTTDPIVYNNAIYGTTGTYGLSLAESTNIIVKNNIGYVTSSGNAYALRIYSNTTVSSIDNNCWYAPNSAYAPDVNYNISGGNTWAEWQGAGYDASGINADPLFEDAVNDDLNLTSSSPCIGAGVDVGLTEDYDGKAVPYGVNPDIGAFEWEETALEINVELKRA